MIVTTIPLVGLGGVRLYGMQFFCFRVHFHRKAPMLEIDALPLTGRHSPLREIQNRPLNTNFNLPVADSMIIVVWIPMSWYDNKHTISYAHISGHGVFTTGLLSAPDVIELII